MTLKFSTTILSSDAFSQFARNKIKSRLQSTTLSVRLLVEHTTYHITKKEVKLGEILITINDNGEFEIKIKNPHASSYKIIAVSEKNMKVQNFLGNLPFLKRSKISGC